MTRRLLYGILGLVVTLIIAGLVALFLFTHERREIEVDLGPEREAQIDEFLALQRYLERLELSVEREPDLGDLSALEELDVIFFHPTLVDHSEWSEEVLGPWLESGGHLYVVDMADRELGMWDLTRELDLELSPRHEWGLDPVWRDKAQAYETSSTGRIDVSSASLSSPLPTFDTGGILMPSGVDFAAVGGDDNPLFLSAPRGRGRVTVVYREELLSNSFLPHGEIGQALADTMTLQRQWPEGVGIYLDDRRWSWIGTVFRRGWPFFVAIALLLIFGLSRARRFGPPIPQPDRRRRRRGEHIRAVGHFLWNHHGGDALVEASRRALVEAVARRRPSIKTMARAKKIRIMAEQLQVSEERMRSLLDGPIPRRPADYWSLIAKLEKLRRKL